MCMLKRMACRYGIFAALLYITGMNLSVGRITVADKWHGQETQGPSRRALKHKN
ncbi:hypothetical protein SODALDRAFT_379845 [Sodiomyces alkalinus F11]|uniref:Uncharacterized protein n=1 Tax=Sodiomyces alkalinus (strain CBS 110278 / VKM F-3762 / F11) TaxID=1314773 RepID=A0A3N2PSB2_SODAK|nr:hypothetical protein SODALDRAFT_379845 [Sodiomyces alkalinus F11]ROT37378.1 hypothetical protein SODALDRAFT_379845 [Sodiomyces alkalinus F11]